VRVAFFLLLLINLAFFAWAQWLAPKEEQLPVSPKVEAAQLRLVAEASPAVADGSCVTVGPFATTDLAARARQTLTDTGYPSVPRQVTTPVPDGFWVYLESPPTEAGERRLLERLRRGGVDDAQAVGETGARRISLGVFYEESRAFAQSEKVARLGLLPQIVGREKSSSAIWLDLTLKSGATPLEGQKFKAGDAELEFRPCPAAEVNGVGENSSGEGPDRQNPAA
jgi:hypothetical protein